VAVRHWQAPFGGGGMAATRARQLRELGSYARGGELLLLGLRHGDEQPGVEGDGELAPGEAGAACGHAL
jgi:hypothetical protein